MTDRDIRMLRNWPQNAKAGDVLDLIDEIDRLKRGEYTPDEANALVAAVVARHQLTRAQCETALWEWQDKVFGPRQTDGTGSKLGQTGFDGTYPVTMDKLPHVAEGTPGQGG